MNALTINLLSALAVSAIISSMARVRSQKVKSILYVLPFPITIALIGSQSVATSLSMVGLAITAVFLWGCYLLHTRLKANIFFTDVLLCVVYVGVAYLLARFLDLSFWVALISYVVAWVTLMGVFRKKTFRYKDKGRVHTNFYLKALIVFGVAFPLFSAHQYLAAFVVTFPYNGVFAVYENRNGLLPQAALFTRNSLALTAYFVANYLVGTQHRAVIRYICSWAAFGIVLLVVHRLLKLKVIAR